MAQFVNQFRAKSGNQKIQRQDQQHERAKNAGLP